MEMMAQYNATADMQRVASDVWEYGDEKDGFALTPYIREILRDAIRQSRMAFQEDREQVYFAMEVVNRVVAYAAAEGRMALSKEQLFRGENRIFWI